MKSPRSGKPTTYFEQIPVTVVKKIAGNASFSPEHSRNGKRGHASTSAKTPPHSRLTLVPGKAR